MEPLEQELERLRKGHWVTDYGIGTYLKLLADEANKKFGTRIEIISSQYFLRAETLGRAEATRGWKRRKDVSGADLVLWYLNPGGQHWTLLVKVIDPKGKEMKYYDSFLPKTCEYFQSPTIRNFLDNEAVLQGHQPFKWAEWSFDIEKEIPEQFNGCDCGVFLMQYAYCILLKTPMKFRQAQVTELRSIIATEMESRKIQKRNLHTHLPKNAGVTGGSHTHHSDQAMDKTLSDSDFENTLPPSFRGKHKRPPLADVTNSSESPQSTARGIAQVITAVEWEILSPPLQALLPNEDGITYVVSEFTTLPCEVFSGAPASAYEATIRISVSTQDKAQQWMQSMMKHSKCTYRHTRGRAPGLKRVLYKAEMHCQHQQKAPTARQKQKAAETKSKNGKKALMQNVRRKKTGCPSSLKLTVSLPSKKNRIAAAKKPYLVTHPTVLHIVFNHNHPLDSAHVLAFRPIAPETKEQLFDLFQKGHTAASAHHWHETKLYLDGGQDQISVADRAINPTKKDVSRLHSQWQTKGLGDDNVMPSFNVLREPSLSQKRILKMIPSSLKQRSQDDLKEISQ